MYLGVFNHIDMVQHTEVNMVWAPSVSLAATREITIVFYSSGYWDVSLPQVSIWQLSDFAVWTAKGFPIRKCPDQSLLPAPRTLSQAVASFIASMNQGIHYYALRLLLGNLKITSKHISMCRLPTLKCKQDFLILFSLSFLITELF